MAPDQASAASSARWVGRVGSWHEAVVGSLVDDHLARRRPGGRRCRPWGRTGLRCRPARARGTRPARSRSRWRRPWSSATPRLGHADHPVERHGPVEAPGGRGLERATCHPCRSRGPRTRRIPVASAACCRRGHRGQVVEPAHRRHALAQVRSSRPGNGSGEHHHPAVLVGQALGQVVEQRSQAHDVGAQHQPVGGVATVWAGPARPGCRRAGRCASDRSSSGRPAARTPSAS